MNSSNLRTGFAAEEVRQAFRDSPRCRPGRLGAVATKHALAEIARVTAANLAAFPAAGPFSWIWF